MKVEKNQKIDANNWVDPSCYFFILLIRNANKITTKVGGVTVFGQKELVGQDSITVKFTKIGQYVSMGVSDIQNK